MPPAPAVQVPVPAVPAVQVPAPVPAPLARAEPESTAPAEPAAPAEQTSEPQEPERRVELSFRDGTVLRLPPESALAEQMLALAGSVTR